MDLPLTEEVEETSLYPVNCSKLTSIQFWHLDLVRGITGAVSLFICSLVLFLLLLHKAYASLLQRFLLYSAVATWLNEASITMQIEHLVKYAGQRQFCIAVGFLGTWNSLMFTATALEITLLLTYRVFVTLRGQLLNSSSWSKYSKVSLEVTAVCLAVFVPLALSVVPFIHRTYGLSGPWCWITTLNADCKKIRTWAPYIVGTISYLAAGLVIGICVVYVIILFCVSACQSSNSRRINCKLIRDNVILLAFYLVYFAFIAVEDSAHLLSGIKHDYDNYSLWLAYAIGPPFNKLALLLGFLFYIYSFKNLTLGSFRILKGICYRCHQHCSQRMCLASKDDVSTPMQKARNVTGGPTYGSSHPQVYPSETVISPLYTGAFTSITKRESSDECERQQLITSLNVGYSSLHGNVEHELQ